MRGLRTQESEKFQRFFQIVQKEAAKNNAVFFFDTGEGRDFLTDVMEGEDLCGWLVPLTDAAEFEARWASFQELPERMRKYFVFAIWDGAPAENNITVSFQKF